jgi:hypothetical protein
VVTDLGIIEAGWVAELVGHLADVGLAAEVSDLRKWMSPGSADLGFL